MKFKLIFAAVSWIIRNGPAVVEAIKAARDRHPDQAKEAVSK